jgi:ABC-2 type transport system permease protein
MRLVGAHVGAKVRELLRIPGLLVPTVVFPCLLFVFLGAPNAHAPEAAAFFVGSYAVVAMLGVALFQFGVNLADERATPWEVYLRTLPIAPRTRLIARIITAVAFATVACGLVVLVALVLTPLRSAALDWPRFALVVLVGGIPFALGGIALAYLTSPRAATPLANILYLLLAFAGGLWVTPDSLPALVAGVSPALPTRQYAELIWSAVQRRDWPGEAAVGLLAYTVLFGVLAGWGYQRDEGQTYR